VFAAALERHKFSYSDDNYIFQKIIVYDNYIFHTIWNRKRLISGTGAFGSFLCGFDAQKVQALVKNNRKGQPLYCYSSFICFRCTFGIHPRTAIHQ
jgi:hypothetical protein